MLAKIKSEMAVKIVWSASFFRTKDRAKWLTVLWFLLSGYVREKAPQGGSRTCNEHFPIEYSNSVDLFNIQRLAANAVELHSAQHRLVRNEDYKYKVCFQCHKDKTKTKKGWRVYTHFKCEHCNIPLCTGGRGTRRCFEIFHRERGITEIIAEYDPRMLFSNMK